MPVESVEGFWYILEAVDDYSSLPCIAGIRKRSQLPEKMQQAATMLQTQCGEQVKKLRSDRGGEYLNGHFSDYLMKQGMIHEATAGYAWASNGVAKRFLRALQDGVSTWMQDSGLMMTYWCCVAQNVAHDGNRMPHATVPKTPREMCFAAKPDIEC
jgi:transposase InsO family protein